MQATPLEVAGSHGTYETGEQWSQRARCQLKIHFIIQKNKINKQDLTKLFPFFCCLQGTLLFPCCLDSSLKISIKIECDKKNFSTLTSGNSARYPKVSKWSYHGTRVVLNHLFFPAAVYINWNTCFKDSDRKVEESTLIYKKHWKEHAIVSERRKKEEGDLGKLRIKQA